MVAVVFFHFVFFIVIIFDHALVFFVCVKDIVAVSCCCCCLSPLLDLSHTFYHTPLFPFLSVRSLSYSSLFPVW